MFQPVVDALIPVVLLIAIGFVSGRLGFIKASAVKDLSNLVFLVLTPALLFRTMSTVKLQQLDFGPVAMYFVATGLIFGSILALRGFNRRAAVMALASTFSNTLMIGVPLVGLAYGQAGLVVLFTLVSVHALVLLTSATLVLEFAVAREAAGGTQTSPRQIMATAAKAARSAVIHPVPLPIMAGLLFAQTGLTIPAVVDKPLQLLGSAFSPLALVLVGVTLASTAVGPHFKGALALATVKNVVHPLLLACIAWALSLSGLTLWVMVVTASLPIGANVFLFSQRYHVVEELTTAAVVVSTVVAVMTIPLFMWLVHQPSFCSPASMTATCSPGHLLGIK